MRFAVPYPPSLNTYYRIYQGRILLSEKARAYLNDFKYALWGCSWYRKELLKMPFMEELEVCIEVYPPDKRKRDLDNTLKCLLDSMQKCGIYKDDSQIARLNVIRKEIIINGKVEIVITEKANDIQM
jgi:crossover junction endodeoxyribonuclease RusA